MVRDGSVCEGSSSGNTHPGQVHCSPQSLREPADRQVATAPHEEPCHLCSNPGSDLSNQVLLAQDPRHHGSHVQDRPCSPSSFLRRRATSCLDEGGTPAATSCSCRLGRGGPPKRREAEDGLTGGGDRAQQGECQEGHPGGARPHPPGDDCDFQRDHGGDPEARHELPDGDDRWRGRGPPGFRQVCGPDIRVRGDDRQVLLRVGEDDCEGGGELLHPPVPLCQLAGEDKGQGPEDVQGATSEKGGAEPEPCDPTDAFDAGVCKQQPGWCGGQLGDHGLRTHEGTQRLHMLLWGVCRALVPQSSVLPRALLPESVLARDRGYLIRYTTCRTSFRHNHD